jgi:hypothetical protein
MPDESRLQSALIRHTVLYCTESDATRCCDNIIKFVLLKMGMLMLDTYRGL